MTLILPLSLCLTLPPFGAPSSNAQTAPTKPVSQQRVLHEGSSSVTLNTPTYKAEAFLGTWEWRSGANAFRLTLTREVNFPIPNGRTMHFIIGRHSYTRNGTVVEESYTRTPADPNGRSFLGQPNDDWHMNMGFIDRTKDKRGRANMDIDPDSPNQMQFELHETEGMVRAPGPPPGFTIPTTMTLTRVP